MIKNISKNTIVSKDYSYKTGLSKTKGLLFNKTAKTLVFKTGFGIHTFFMKFPIDLMILNNKMKVVFIKEHIKPNRVIFWNPKYTLVVEMPQGSISKSKTSPGDIISLHI